MGWDGASDRRQGRFIGEGCNSEGEVSEVAMAASMVSSCGSLVLGEVKVPNVRWKRE